MRGSTLKWLLPPLVAMTLSPASAWSPTTRVAIVDEAVRLMPGSLQIALQAHRQALLRGMLEPMVREDDVEHRSPRAAGSLDATLAGAAKELGGTLATPTPFDEIAGRFGRLAHYVADAGFPPGASGSDDDARYAHFAGFCESRREKFPVVFYGHDETRPAAEDYAAFARRVIAQAAEIDERLARAYAEAGDPPRPEAFDDRSVPFAVGSVSYSRTITDVVRIWLEVWRRAGGDIGRTPYLELDTESSPRSN